MANDDIALMAHLFRRAGFGAPRDVLEEYIAKGYEATVEELLYPENQPEVDIDLMERYMPEFGHGQAVDSNQMAWMFRMINTRRQLQEKLTLFWHGILCTGYAKTDHARMCAVNVDLYRRIGFGSVKELLLELSKDATMVFYLDNVVSHKDAPNENYGRELLELFSLGVGMDGKSNYTEDDVKAAGRAFTGWGLRPVLPVFPYCHQDWKFRYDATDHDDSVKTFLGETGRFNGEDIVEIVMKQPATARFIARHLYNFFVADEPQVPNWKDTPPRDIEAIKTLEKAFVDNDFEIRPVLRVLFNSNFFENTRFAKVKNPVEVVVGTLRLVKDHTELRPGFHPVSQLAVYMGQELLNPPSVEGWHTGPAWIDSGTLVERINFVTEQMGNLDLPGVKLIVDRMSKDTTNMSPEGFVDGCLDLIGPLEVSDKTRNVLIEHANSFGELRRATEEDRVRFGNHVAQMLQLIGATAEYQYA